MKLAEFRISRRTSWDFFYGEESNIGVVLRDELLSLKAAVVAGALSGPSAHALGAQRHLVSAIEWLSVNLAPTAR